MIFLQLLDLQERIVTHLKDLIHIYLELEDQDLSRTLKITYTLSNNPYFASLRGKKPSFLKGTVYHEILGVGRYFRAMVRGACTVHDATLF